MPNDHEISIRVSDADFTELYDLGFALYAFRALGTSAASALPVVWKKVPLVLNPIRLTWSETFAAYVISGSFPAGARVDASHHTRAEPGQKVIVLPGGSFDVRNGGPAGQITIESTLPARVTCGLATIGDDGKAAPIATMPLYPGAALSVAPLLRIVLLFAAQESLDAGIVIRDFPSSAPPKKNREPSTLRGNRATLIDDGSVTPLMQLAPCLVDCSASSSIEIAYDLDTGTWTPASCATTLRVETPLVPLLVHART